ncbi:MAG TPA: EAL domain-containing protein [Acidimicrobiia bacterium]|nr:EAL domain-containing protein [Acidimicrobiia bacterium]
MTDETRGHSFLRRYAGELGLALVTVLWSGWLLWGSGTPSTQTVSNLGLTAVPFVVAMACLLRGLRLRGSLRRFWILLGASAAAWGVGQTIWTLYETGLGREVPFPSWADAGYLAAVPLAVAALLVLPAAAQSMAGLLRIVLDGVMVALALFCTSWILVLGQLFAAGGDNLLSTILSLAYPVGDVVTITMLIFALLRARQGGEAARQPLYLIGLGLTGIALADSGFVYLTSQTSYTSGSFIDIGWFAGFAVLFVAARRPERPVAAAEAERGLRFVSSLSVPYTPVVIMATTVLFQHLRGEALDGTATFTAMAVLLLIVLRQVLTLRENLALVRNLEERVERRTADHRRLQEELAHQAFHDSLTGLANRALFKDRVEHALTRLQRRRRPLAVFFLDLDRFKAINDSFGHASGDALLIAVSRRLRDCVRAEDTVARLGGDEFAVLVENLAGDAEVRIVADRVKEAFRDPIVIDGRELAVAASIGIALSEAGAETADDLLRNADLAMYRAKAAGGGARQYIPEMHAGMIERLELESDLRQALAREQLYLVYQPIVDLQTGRLSGAEALLRWQHPTRGVVSPADFIPVAESSGMIVPIGEWVLRQACRDARRWDEIPGGEALSVSVNLSGRQLQTSELPSVVPHALLEAGLAPGRLTLEMTESVLIDRSDEMLALLHELRRIGVRLAIDDFGTGYSSLSYLHRFPVDIVKVDRSFVESLTGEADEISLAESIIRIGQGLRVTTVAEGIEDTTQLEALQRLGCDHGQGYYFARPMSAADFEAYIAEREAWRAA